MQTASGAGLSVGYTYDSAGVNTQLSYPDGKKVNDVYDLDGRMTSLTDWANHKVSFAWTADSLLSKQTDPNEVVSTRVYDKNDQITSVSVANTKTTATTLASYLYGFDAGGAVDATGAIQYLHSDNQGLVRLINNSVGPANRPATEQHLQGRPDIRDGAETYGVVDER